MAREQLIMKVELLGLRWVLELVKRLGVSKEFLKGDRMVLAREDRWTLNTSSPLGICSRCYQAQTMYHMDKIYGQERS